ncbi:transposase [Marivita sp.]|uniref:transposase n=1 Tax=Marivita sp. TaxID=2003365 RepID=UPI003F71651E
MRSAEEASVVLFRRIDLQERFSAQHPWRNGRQGVDETPNSRDAELTAVYGDLGRPAIPPERPVRACLIQVLFVGCAERHVMDQMHYILLYRWFMGLGLATRSGVRWDFRLVPEPRSGAFVEGRRFHCWLKPWQRGNCRFALNPGFRDPFNLWFIDAWPARNLDRLHPRCMFQSDP